MNLDDTILAPSSPPDPSGPRAILRFSGPDASRLAGLITTLLSDAGPGHHPVRLRDLTAFPCAALVFHAPRSFTGQDVVELHVPNSPALIRHLLDGLLAAARTERIAARLAEPGEFSARAFFHNKIDLTEAEGIAATINAHNETQLRAAASLRSGDLHQWTRAVTERLANVLALLEAGIDFVDEEDVHFIDAAQLVTALQALRSDLHNQLAHSLRIDRLDEPPTVLFTGLPNVGKSSLINALSGSNRAIVSPVAGTTRDALAALMPSHMGLIRLVDVPGIESADDELRCKMNRAREQALLDADLLVHVTAPDVPAVADPPENPGEVGVLEVVNKSDMLSSSPTAGGLHVSAVSGENLDQLRNTIISRLGASLAGAGSRLVLNHRHRALMHAAADTLQSALELLAQDAAHTHPELLAAELRRGLDLLGQITGTISPDEVLGRIFSTFCIGK